MRRGEKDRADRPIEKDGLMSGVVSGSKDLPPAPGSNPPSAVMSVGNRPDRVVRGGVPGR